MTTIDVNKICILVESSPNIEGVISFFFLIIFHLSLTLCDALEKKTKHNALLNYFDVFSAILTECRFQFQFDDDYIVCILFVF